MATEAPPILEVRGLKTYFPLRERTLRAVDDVSFSLRRGRTLCIVGESGSGKSITARSILQIVGTPGRIVGGQILYTPEPGRPAINIARLHPRRRQMRALRGREIAMVFQEPMTSLSPIHRIGWQIAEAMLAHRLMDRRAAHARAVELLREVEIPTPETAVDRYSFEFSGGMGQRAMIAMALACNPKVLIADEPTTALDVTTQAEVGALFSTPTHPYTIRLLEAAKKLGMAAPPARPAAPTAEKLLEVRGLTLTYPAQASLFRLVRPPTPAVRDVSFDMYEGENLGIVGESGSGKTTLGLSLIRVLDPTLGKMRYRRRDGGVVDLATLAGAGLRQAHREIRMVFQDPLASLNPRMTIQQIVGEPLLVNGILPGVALAGRVRALLGMVGLPRDAGGRYPHAFSGGQRQRIVFARALALDARLIIADEATSALDVTLRGQILDLLLELQPRLGLSFICISHDLGVIRYFCDRVAAMYRGEIVEIGDADAICARPTQPYTQRLLAAVPEADPSRRLLLAEAARA